jgi:hypothetical protein
MGSGRSLYHKEPLSCDLSDEITGIPVICEYTLRPVNICSFYRPRFLFAWLSIANVWDSLISLGYSSNIFCYAKKKICAGQGDKSPCTPLRDAVQTTLPI